MKGSSNGQMAAGGLVVDYSNAKASVGILNGSLGNEMSRIKDQLRLGYLFESDKKLPPEKREVVDGFLTADGTPTFQAYRSEPAAVVKSAGKIIAAYGEPKNVVVIGNGGSISSCDAFYNALAKFSASEKRLFILDSVDPDQIAYVRRECNPKDTIVVPISKSGTTQGVLDALDQFMGYPLAAVTTKKPGKPLYETVKKALSERGIASKFEDMVIDHPPIGGRYSGRTPVGTLPLALLGMGESDLRALDMGAQAMYEHVNPNVPIEKNPALRLAAALYHLERTEGRDIIFAPMYSHRLDGFGHLITQLLHESSGKIGRGQTILTASAPESQHHTNQRLFGGKNNMTVVFFTIDKPQTTGLKASDGLPLEKALQFEYEGTRDDATASGIPNFTIHLKDARSQTVGALLAFSQYAFGAYPSLLRDVNPFDQPQVENSKSISRELRREWLEGRLP